MDYEWKNFILEIITLVKKYDNAVIVGIKGSLKDRNNDDKVLRVYMNGGRILDIFMFERKFRYAENYIKKHEQYFAQEDFDKLMDIISQVESNKFILKDNKFALLRQYLDIIDRATRIKFNELKSSKTKEAKERSKQTVLFKRELNGIVLFDFEFQTIKEMNYFDEKDLQNWLKKENDYRIKHDIKTIKKPHCGKPDYVGFSEDGFELIELKTNAKALEGNAGVNEHSNDIDKMILVNASNHILVKELKERLKIAIEYGLIDKRINIAEELLKEDDEEIVVGKKFIFILNSDLTSGQCDVFIKKNNIDRRNVIIVQS